ncbi:MAG: hypothetical protein J0L72_07475 [Armatimonadetes bacterium]|nr:hypothetical protein [Armatimonadota bacterium]
MKLTREVEWFKYCEKARSRIEKHGIQPVVVDERKWSGYLMNSEGKIVSEKRVVTEQIAMMIENGEFGDIW